MKMANKWTIWLANLDPVIGSEQGKKRPVIIISEDDINALLNIVNIIPVTTRKEGRTIYPNEALLETVDTGLKNQSIALCHQIRTLDKKRLTNKIGIIKSETAQSEIIEALCFQLGINLL
jgi:mRNA interferase MazF